MINLSVDYFQPCQDSPSGKTDPPVVAEKIEEPLPSPPAEAELPASSPGAAASAADLLNMKVGSKTEKEIKFLTQRNSKWIQTSPITSPPKKHLHDSWLHDQIPLARCPSWPDVSSLAQMRRPRNVSSRTVRMGMVEKAKGGAREGAKGKGKGRGRGRGKGGKKVASPKSKTSPKAKASPKGKAKAKASPKSKAKATAAKSKPKASPSKTPKEPEPEKVKREGGGKRLSKGQEGEQPNKARGQESATWAQQHQVCFHGMCPATPPIPIQLPEIILQDLQSSFQTWWCYGWFTRSGFRCIGRATSRRVVPARCCTFLFKICHDFVFVGYKVPVHNLF